MDFGRTTFWHQIGLGSMLGSDLGLMLGSGIGLVLGLVLGSWIELVLEFGAELLCTLACSQSVQKRSIGATSRQPYNYMI